MLKTQIERPFTGHRPRMWHWRLTVAHKLAARSQAIARSNSCSSHTLTITVSWSARLPGCSPVAGRITRSRRHLAVTVTGSARLPRNGPVAGRGAGRRCLAAVTISGSTGLLGNGPIARSITRSSRHLTVAVIRTCNR